MAAINLYNRALQRISITIRLPQFNTAIKRSYTSHSWSNSKPIYQGPLATSVRLLKIFSLSTCAATIIGTPILIAYGKKSIPVKSKIIIASALISVSVATTALLHWFSKRYVLQAYCNPTASKYMMETYTLFARRNTIEFTPNDVKIPKADRMFSNVIIFNKPYLFHTEVIQHRQLLMLITGFNFSELEQEFSNRKLDKP